MSDDTKRYGHPRFYELLEEFAELHSKKNKDYAQGGKPTGNFDRVSTILSLYPGLDLSRPQIVALVFMLKQFDAVMWSLAQGYETAVESRHDKMRDMAVYSTLAIVLEEEEKDRSTHGKSIGEPTEVELCPECGNLPKLNCGSGLYWCVCPECGCEGARQITPRLARVAWNRLFWEGNVRDGA